jgi:hypothetical protein
MSKSQAPDEHLPLPVLVRLLRSGAAATRTARQIPQKHPVAAPKSPLYKGALPGNFGE